MSKILVSGGCGYLGSVLVHELVEQGREVVVVDNGIFGFESLESIKNRIEIRKKNIKDIDGSDLDNIESVIHLAGFSNDPQAEFSPKGNDLVNRQYTIDLANKCADAKVKKFIFASSASVYGFDDKNGELKEDHPLNPKSHYAKSKVAAEEALRQFKCDMIIVILRKGTLMGCSPRQRYDLVVNTMMKSIYEDTEINVFGGGEVWRPLLNVIDAATAYIYCLDRANNSDVYNVVHKNYRISELAHYVVHCIETIKPEYRNQIRVNFDYDEDKKDNRSYMISGDKIFKDLGFKTSIGILQTIETFMKNFELKNGVDFDNEIYYNIKRVKKGVEYAKILKENPNVFQEFIETKG